MKNEIQKKIDELRAQIEECKAFAKKADEDGDSCQFLDCSFEEILLSQELEELEKQL